MHGSGKIRGTKTRTEQPRAKPRQFALSHTHTHASEIMKFSLSPRLAAPIMWIFYWLKRAERDATRRGAALAICNITSKIVSGSVETGKNEFTVINFRLVRAIEFRSRNAGSSAREMAKIIDDVSRGCLMEARTRAPRFHARKETESNSSERAREPRRYVISAAPPVPPHLVNFAILS